MDKKIARRIDMHLLCIKRDREHEISSKAAEYQLKIYVGGRKKRPPPCLVLSSVNKD